MVTIMANNKQSTETQNEINTQFNLLQNIQQELQNNTLAISDAILQLQQIIAIIEKSGIDLSKVKNIIDNIVPGQSTVDLLQYVAKEIEQVSKETLALSSQETQDKKNVEQDQQLQQNIDKFREFKQKYDDTKKEAAASTTKQQEEQQTTEESRTAAPTPRPS